MCESTLIFLVSLLWTLLCRNQQNSPKKTTGSRVFRPRLTMGSAFCYKTRRFHQSITESLLIYIDRHSLFGSKWIENYWLCMEIRLTAKYGTIDIKHHPGFLWRSLILTQNLGLFWICFHEILLSWQHSQSTVRSEACTFWGDSPWWNLMKELMNWNLFY